MQISLKSEALSAMLVHFTIIPDPRIERGKLHKLVDVLAISFLASLGGAVGYEDMEDYAIDNEEWLKTFLELPHGIPSHDTIRSVLCRLDPELFLKVVLEAIGSLFGHEVKRHIAIDGKTLCHSFDKSQGQEALHMVSAWAVGERLFLGQVKVDDKSNEITAVPKLIEMLDVKGAVITGDAMICQKEIVEQIISKGGDYVFSLKGNHPSLHQLVGGRFERCHQNQFQDVKHAYSETTDKDHGRIEIRKYWQVDVSAWRKTKEEWKGLRTIGMVEAERIIGEKSSKEVRYFISSLEPNAKEFSKAVRGHWEIENTLHWSLDVQLREDESRIRRDRGPENMAILRRLAVSYLKRDVNDKRSLRRKARSAWVSPANMLKLLQL